MFVCQECGSQSSKWLGRCPDCEAWNSFVEERPVEAAAGGGLAAGGHRYSMPGGPAAPSKYADIENSDTARLTTGIDEFDRVLGGGIVPGSLVLLGGEPGIGKSTLLLQAAANFARVHGPVLYASGEESEHQVKSRGERLGVGDAPLYLLAETCVERILEEIGRVRPRMLVVDSIQTVFSLKFQSAPGSIGQVREAATQFLFTAKGHDLPTFLVGHVTKDGALAGPEGARARRRHGALLRGRTASLAPRRAGDQEPLRRGQRARRVRDDRRRSEGRAESVAAVPGRAAHGHARVGGAVLRGRIAAAAGRGAGAGQHGHLRHRAAHGRRHRQRPRLAAAGGAREARRPGAGRARTSTSTSPAA